ncbi:MAG: hypothetical protein KBH29_11435 [Lutibacter sp.]|nr:hypothetical protein [Lutibacter sp.]
MKKNYSFSKINELSLKNYAIAILFLLAGFSGFSQTAPIAIADPISAGGANSYFIFLLSKYHFLIIIFIIHFFN